MRRSLRWPRRGGRCGCRVSRAASPMSVQTPSAHARVCGRCVSGRLYEPPLVAGRTGLLGKVTMVTWDSLLQPLSSSCVVKRLLFLAGPSSDAPLL